MNKSALAGIFVFFAVLTAHNSTASAQAENGSSQVKIDSTVVTSLQGMPFMGTTPMETFEKLERETHETPPVPPAPKQHKIEEGETLAKIAEANNTTWVRIFYKNTNIADPNAIKPGELLTIPETDEQLTERPLPEAPAPVATTVPRTGGRRTGAVPRAGSSAGNTYSPGYCTWYAKNRRPDLPNSLGNANTWVARAAALGIPTGSTPRAGAVGQQGMHVVYVESVNGDGTVTISEMNYEGWNVVSQRTVPASSFQYIY